MIRKITGLAASILAITALADTKVSQLPAAGAQTGTEVLAEVQAGHCSATGGTCKVTTAQLKAYAQSGLSCSSLSNAAASCSADTTNATNISQGTLALARLPQIGAGTVLGNSGSSTATPSAISIPKISGLTYPTATLTINGTDNFDATNSLLFSSGTTLSGTGTLKASSASGQIAPWGLYVPSDTMDTCVVSGGVCTYAQGSDVGLIVHHISAGHAGGRNTFLTRTFVEGTPAAQPTVGYVGINAIISGSANLLGTAGAYTNYHGSMYALGANIICASGLTYAQICNTQENDVSLAYGANAAEKHAMTLVQTSSDQLNADYDSSALSFQSQESSRSLTFTGDVQGLTAGTLSAAVTNGAYQMVFGDHEQRTVVITGGTSVDWSADAQGALASGTAITTAGFDAPWTYGINLGSYAAYPAFYDNSTLIAMTTPASGPLNARFARAGVGIDFSNVTFHTAEFRFPGLTAGTNGEVTASTLQLNPATADKSKASWTTSGIVMTSPGAFTVTDTTSSGTVTTEAAYALAPVTEAATSTTTVTNLSTLYVPAPAAGSNVTATNLYAIQTNGGIKSSGVVTAGGLITGTAGATLNGATVSLNASSNNNTAINTGSSSGTTTIGNDGTPSTVTVAGTITLGNAGTQNVTLEGGASSGNVNLITGTGTGTITIGNSGNTGKTKLVGLSTGTNADTVCLSSTGVVLIQAAACTISSLRFKYRVRDVTSNALDTLDHVRIAEYYMRDMLETEIGEHGLVRTVMVENRDPNYYHKQIGLIAENVAQVVPDCALYEQDMATPKSYRPECMLAFAIKAQQQEHSVVKRQQVEIYLLAVWCALLTLSHARLHKTVLKSTPDDSNRSKSI